MGNTEINSPSEASTIYATDSRRVDTRIYHLRQILLVNRYITSFNEQGHFYFYGATFMGQQLLAFPIIRSNTRILVPHKEWYKATID